MKCLNSITFLFSNDYKFRNYYKTINLLLVWGWTLLNSKYWNDFHWYEGADSIFKKAALWLPDFFPRTIILPLHWTNATVQSMCNLEFSATVTLNHGKKNNSHIKNLGLQLPKAWKESKGRTGTRFFRLEDEKWDSFKRWPIVIDWELQFFVSK